MQLTVGMIGIALAVLLAMIHDALWDIRDRLPKPQEKEREP